MDKNALANGQGAIGPESAEAAGGPHRKRKRHAHACSALDYRLPLIIFNEIRHFLNRIFFKAN